LLRIRLTRAPQTRPADAAATPGKISALDAAAKVLAEEGRAMGARDVVAAMPATGYWTSPGGKTPASTLYSAILKETQTKGTQARFTKTERGKFSLAVRG
jgi:HB1, ASXL, restriction endonuclease HTH domain